jgi:amino acid adenylation domain-containing protein
MSIQDLARAAGISAEDEELLALLLAEEGVELGVSDSIQHLPGRAEAPLSFAQERLWFLDRLLPGTATYNIPSAVRLTGELRLDVFARCWREILRRHDSLRTHFETRDGVPVQAIDAAPTPGSELVLVDLSGLPATLRQGTSQRLVREEAARPFDLEHGPVARAVLLRLDGTPQVSPKGEHVLVLNLHHIVSDGWSMGVLVREVAILYGAYVQNRPSPLPELEIQYADFADWQRTHLAGEVLEAELAYWRERLKGAPALALPTDRPRPAIPSYLGKTLPFAIPERGLAPLRALTEAQGATLFITLLAALDVLFKRYTGQDDVVLGSMIANRNRPEIEGLIGFFINALTLRNDLSGDPSFRQLLDRVRDVAFGAFAHQDLPFEKLVAEVQPGRDLSRSPLFQVVFLLQNTPQSSLELPGLTLEMVATEAKMAKFDLQITAAEGAPGVAGSLNYSTDLFDDATVVRLRGHLETLLAGIAADPDRPLSRLPVIPAAESQQVLFEWNETGDVPGVGGRRSCLHELFAAQAARTPAATAIVDAARRWSYAELDAESNRLARYLRGLGVGPEARVGLCLPRTGRMVAAMLAVLKAGGAYVGLDPRYPKDRLAFMLADAAAIVLLTEEGQLAALPAHDVPVVLLDDAAVLASLAALAADTSEPLPRDGRSAGPGNLAYLIYTSGSTGRPKGVAIEHASAAAMVGWAWQAFPAPVLAGVLASTSICFDLSVFEIFVPLAGGGKVIVAENALALPAHPAAGEVTLINTVPSAIAGLVRGGTLPAMPAMPAMPATINLAGEALKRELVEEIYRQPGVREVRNLYGPSEDTTYSTWTAVPSDRSAGASAGGRAPAIGRPLTGSRAYLLDADRAPVPLGAVGELYLAGAGLARGYLGRPDLTADRFLPDPFSAFSEVGGERLYRTGDLARYRPDGALDYLGRIDHQVKVRGFRIELGEIEAAIQARPEIAEVVVLAREDNSGTGGGQRLVAYVVAKSEPGPDLVASLRGALAEKLPEYMVPAVFVVLPALPLTANGKVDRAALPAPEATSAGTDRERVLPRDAVETLLAGLWADVLGLPEVGVEEDFFELGGSSITSAVLVNRLQATLQEIVPVLAVFQARTIARLAARLAADHPAAVARIFGIKSGIEPGIAAPGGIDAAGAGSLYIPSRPWHAGDTAPLSYAQERLWFLDQLDPGQSTYNIPLALRLDGRLDLPAMAAALSEIVRRHQALRTTFEARGEEPVQVIGPALPVPLALVDLAGLPEGLRDAEALRLATAEARRPFDLARGPVLRASLLKLRTDRDGRAGDAAEHAALLNVHHIASDGWSTGVLVRELASLYEAATAGRPSPLPELPIQYADFAGWQRRWLAGDVLAAQLDYWRRTLAGVPALQLPTDRPRPAVASFRGATLPFALSEKLGGALLALGRTRGASVFMTLLAAFQALLSRGSGQEDVAVGSPIANRTRAEVEGLIGFFVNTLVLRGDLAGAPSFEALLDRTREAALGAYAHQDLPFEKVVGEVQPERDLSRSPLFQVMLLLQNAQDAQASRGELRLPGLTLKPQGMEGGAAKFDLTLGLGEGPRGLVGGLEYARDLFDEATAARLLGYFETLLAGLVAHPGQPVADLPLMPEAERRQVLLDWNATGPGLASGRCLHELFAAQAARTPAATALVDGERRRTYGELDAWSNRLARHFRALGVGPEVRVALCVERSAAMVAAMLGVLKAGGAYVGLDPRYPKDRLAFMLEDAAAAVLVTEERLLGLLPETAAQVVRLDDAETAAAIDGESALPLPGRGALPGNLAYLIYTSGSTGRPKGVAIEHASAAAMVGWARQAFSDAALSGVLASTSICFDLSVFEIFVPLAWGGTVIVAENALALSTLQAASEVTLVNTVPSALAGLLRTGGLPSGVPGGMTVNLAGEALKRELVEEIYRQPGIREVRNLYGPSEDTTYSTWTTVAPARSAADRPPAIGRPLAGTRVYLLDVRLAPVPLGGPGELYLAGAGLARGYLGRPDLTAERFVPDAFSTSPTPPTTGGERLYRTGDLARYRPDGDLDYLGRIDHQVKVRGFRIELGEIEAALAAHPAVAEAAVLVRDEAEGDRGLVAYVAAREPANAVDAGTLAATLRGDLRRQLPDYMVPGRFAVLPRLPLTPNGKVDRKALVALAVDASGEAGERGGYVAPRTPVEELLAGIWGQMLGISAVGANDNFFDLGGHSLLVTRMVSRIAETFGVELPLRRLFEAPVLAAQAAQIAAAQAGREAMAPPIVPLPTSAREGGLPLSFAQERLWFIDQFDPGRATYNVPTALRAVGRLEVGLLAAALQEIVRRHESLRTTFAVSAVGGGQAVQVIAPEGEIPFPVVDLSGLPEAVRGPLAERLVAAGAWRPFDLATGPLLRAQVLRLGQEEHALLLTMHHIVSDGWSMEILIREIATLYRAFVEGEAPALPPLPIQYGDFAVWQRGWLTGAVLESQLAYWRERLAGAPPVLDLPIDHPRPAVHTWNGERLGRPLPVALSAGLREVLRSGQRGQSTLFMGLLAAWDALLLRWTGQSDLSVGTPIAGRTHREVFGLIGFFVNTLVLRVRLAGRPTFGDVLQRAREAALGAYDHQDVPLEKLVEELAVERSLEHTPLFQVMLIVQQGEGAGGGSGAGELALPGLVLSPLGSDSRTAKFDMTLIFQQGQPGKDGLNAVLGYNTDLFRRDTVLRLLGQLEGLLAGMTAEPERPVADLPLLTLPERHQLLLAWNDTPITLAGAGEALVDRCLHQLFEAWAARQPEAPAAVFDGDLLTYGDLDRRAGRLAARLRQLGVGPEARVGLCLPRSFDLLTALLAVLKTGAAYVPLDPANPKDRLLFLLADSRVPVLLTVRSLADELGEPLVESSTRVLCLDEEPWGDEISAVPAVPAADVYPDNLAYVIYTSGSTGTPNGVLVPHRGAVNLIREAAALYEVTPESRILQTASVGFDASVLEIFLALAHGASLCLVREEERLTPAVLADRLIGQKVTIGVVTPSLLSVLPEVRLQSLRSLSVGGEACPVDLAARWAPGRRFLNCYGPTEATIFATVAILSGREEKITIGRPVGGALAYVVDRELLPVPIGAVGELVVGGVGLARGYLDRAEKTAAKFVPDPLSGQAGERLYRTGDLARFTPAGEIEFLGRLDDQVKVRGFRIELGEIEAALLRHPGLQAAVVLAPADAQGERKLIAYAAGPSEERPSEAALRAFLAEHLPEYMVPVHLVLLDALPTTPGGKVDRRALPDPEGSRRTGGEAEHVEPRTAAERFVAGLWRQVLRVERVSATDDFFALGGNSIKGAILTNLLQEKLGEYVYVVALFDAPTLAALARYLEENYTESLERVTGEKVTASGAVGGRVEPAMLVILRKVIPPLAPKLESAGKNRRAVFLLSPPRSGSTLLRVMLAGNPALFAPPELELLGFNTLEERKAALSGRWALWQEGTIRALMEVYACDAEEARRRMDDAEARGLTVQQLYGELQEAIGGVGGVGGRLLVDKTPSYALDPATLARAEEDFAAPLYVHLLRHPYGMIRSFEKAKLEQVFFRPSHPFDRRQLAELIWDVSQENILDLLSRVPAERQIQLRFEEMLTRPEREMRRLCEFLGVPFDPGMLDPYADKAQRMTDGIHQLSKMVGDVKFHEHKGIEAQTADSWRREIAEDFLGDVTWELAARLGYQERAQERVRERAGFSPLVALRPTGSRPPLYLVHPVGGNVLCYAELSRLLGDDQPVYGLQSLGLAPGAAADIAPEETVEAMAATYVAALREAQPRGPYRLGGWSIGGVLAYAMAHELRGSGEEVELLALFDSLAPVRSRGEGSLGDHEAPEAIDDALLLAGLARDLAGLSGRPVALAPAELAGLDPEAGLARVIERVREAGALPAGVSAEQIGRLWRVFRANVRAVRAYRPSPVPAATTGIALFVTHGNPERDSLGADLGWGKLVGGGLAVSELSGDHYSLLREPVVRELADGLSRRLEAL